jgi:hypothetical protein
MFGKTIRLATSAGLCNRLRSLDSCVNLSRILDARLELFWPVNKALGASFFDLFEASSLFTVRQVRPYQSRLARYLARLGESIGVFQCFRDPESGPVGSIHGTKYFGSIPTKILSPFCRTVFLETDHAFLYPEDYSYLRPIKFIRDEIVRVSERLRPLTVGVHIRRGDHVSAIEHSPLAGFISKMEQHADEFSEARFYLATDDEECRAGLIDRFGDRIITQHGSVSRESVQGVQSAVVDLWCLAKCGQIWGSLGSSFSEMGFHLGAKELHYIDGQELRLAAKRQKGAY